MNKSGKHLHLGSVSDIIMGQSPDSRSCNTNEVGLPFLQGCAEFGSSYPNPEVHCFQPLRISPPDSILISVRAPVGKMNWSDQEYCIGRGLGSIRAKEGLANSHFLKHAVDQGLAFLHRRSQGSTFLAIGSNDLSLFPIPDFPKSIQDKIANILNTIDQAIEKTEALIEKYQHIKAGLMHDLFTRGITANGKLRPPKEQAPELYQETPIGWIPKEWDIKSILEIVNFPSGQVSPLSPPYIDWMLVAPDHIESRTGRLLERVSARDQGAISGKYIFEKGDIVYSKIRPYLRKAIIADFQGLCSADIYPLKIKDNNNPIYILGLILGERFSKYADTVSMRSGFPKINRSEFAGFKTGLPKPTEQNLIANSVSAIDSKIITNQKLLNKLKQKKSGLMHDLLTGQVQVKLPSNVMEEEA